jgi:branched-subunit amino acid aminotransferase/4-amino-4-deoxychorismate lyase
MLTGGGPEIDGVPVSAGHAASLASLSFGHFSTMVVDDLRVRGLQLHLDRLVRDCATVFGAALDPDRVRALLRRAAVRCTRPALLRATVFGPAGSLARPGLGDHPDARPSVLVSTRATPSQADTGPGLRVQTVSYVRDLPAVKHAGTFGQLHQRRQAQLAGFDDALFITGPEPDARVCEGPTWNVAMLIDDELVWPDDGCLPGVTRELLRPLTGTSDAGWSSRPISRAELPNVRAAFATSAGVGVLPIAEIDGVQIPGDLKLLTRLQSQYAQIPTEAL